MRPPKRVPSAVCFFFTLQAHHAATSELQRQRTMKLRANYRQARRCPASLQESLVRGVKEVNASGKTFTVKSTLELKVDRKDDGVTITCRVDHESLSSAPQLATQVLKVHYAPVVKIIPPPELPQEGHYLTLVCDFSGNPIPEPVIWTKDGGELPDPDRMTVNGRELTIAFLNKTDNGTYRCEVSNSIGQDNAEYVLFVYGPS
ncbi:UNVERIFIED_CONTAM: hypothetical protein FKN15_048158 [Acipenser sinensis]